jgi:hypothetical protein
LGGGRSARLDAQLRGKYFVSQKYSGLRAARRVSVEGAAVIVHHNC